MTKGNSHYRTGVEMGIKGKCIVFIGWARLIEFVLIV